MGTVSMAVAGIPDVSLSTATTAAGTQVSVFCTNVLGTSKTLLQAQTAAGVITDATITLTLLDGNGDPIFNYPFEDLWLATSLNGFVSCSPSLPIGNTNQLGITTFVGANLGKGHSDRLGGVERCVVMISGTPLSGSGLDILFNSADINGDNIVNSLDLGLFVSALKGIVGTDPYHGNLQYDAAVNSLDLGVFVGQLKSTTQGCQ
jgi:hypothetical protein